MIFFTKTLADRKIREISVRACRLPDKNNRENFSIFTLREIRENLTIHEIR